MSLASGQRPYLKSVGLLSDAAAKADPVTWLLDTALDGSSIVFLPFSAGVMTHFERDFYAGTIPDDGLNAAWWAHARRYQGIAPPAPRPETLCDAATKTHINDDPAQYYDYAIATVLKFQLHDHIAREILKQDPHDCNYFGNAEVGRFLRGILELGATRDWDAVLQEATGESLTARPMMAYFAPLAGVAQGAEPGEEGGVGVTIDLIRTVSDRSAMPARVNPGRGHFGGRPSGSVRPGVKVVPFDFVRVTGVRVMDVVEEVRLLGVGADQGHLGRGAELRDRLDVLEVDPLMVLR